MSIGDNIRAARIECNMTQAELAEKVGLSQSTIALYEAGKRELTASQIVPFAHVLDTSPLFLLEGTRGGGGGGGGGGASLFSVLSPRCKRERSLGANLAGLSCRPSLMLLFCFILFILWVRFAVHICTANVTASRTTNMTASLSRQLLSTALPTAYAQLIYSLIHRQGRC